MICDMLANSLDKSLDRVGPIHCRNEAVTRVVVVTGKTRPILDVCEVHAMNCAQFPNTYRS